MDADVIAAAVQYVKLAFAGGVSDEPAGAPVVNAQGESFRTLVSALRADSHIPAFGQDTTDWIRS